MKSAAARGTSENTVANQLKAIYRKLGISSRMELVSRGTGNE
jgi:DNA-binding CsgD family transcriptional regulator